MVLEPPMNSAHRRKLGDITNLQNQKNLMNQGAKQQQQAILVSSKENVEKLQKALLISFWSSWKCLWRSVVGYWEMFFFSFSLTVLIQALYQLVFAGKHETDESRRGERVIFVRKSKSWNLWVWCTCICCWYLLLFCDYSGIKSELQKLRIDFQKVKEQNLLLAQANTRILAVYLIFVWFSWKWFWEFYGYSVTLMFIFHYSFLAGVQYKQRPSMLFLEPKLL